MLMGEKGCASPPRPTAARRSIVRPIAPERRIRVVAASRPTLEDDLAKARTAWVRYQSTRQRDAVYGYLSIVFEIVRRWKMLGHTRTYSLHALAVTKHRGAIRTRDPFGIVVFCTSDPRIVDARTRSKWSRALRAAARTKPAGEALGRFMKRQGGINECSGSS
jgi:hypothetical protein